ncbi:DUF4258 domain-containing protein [Candidatus Poribacteria bacterium]|nr:DUF4258 domain-containing protein [Candidatus Poribacteria bacterium]
MDLEQIQGQVKKGQWRITTHAAVEATKDGVSPKDVKQIILTGKIIESYPDRERHLIYGMLSDMSNLPVHVVVDYSNDDQIVAVTAYVPDDKEWIASQKRKR